MGQHQTTGLWLDGDDVIERKSQDVEPIIDHCHNLRAVGATGSSEMRHAASLPHAVIENYLAQHPGVQFCDIMRANSPHIRAMLNDPDLKKFRIWEGRL